MSNKSFYFILSIATIWALLAGSLPMANPEALGNSSGGKSDCPSMDTSLMENPGFIKSLPPKCRGEVRRTNLVQQSTLSRSQLLITSGPDNFGYTFDDTVPLNWVSATIATGVSGDDNSGQLNVGFNF